MKWISVLIEILCKLVRLISRNPIGVNVKLYYGIMGKENLRKERLNWTNWKVLDLIGWLWEVGGTNVQLSPKSTYIFDFIDFYYISLLEEKNWDKRVVSSFLLPVTPHHLHLLPSSFLLKILQYFIFFLLQRCVSWILTLVLHVLLRKLVDEHVIF